MTVNPKIIIKDAMNVILNEKLEMPFNP